MHYNLRYGNPKFVLFIHAKLISRYNQNTRHVVIYYFWKFIVLRAQNIQRVGIQSVLHMIELVFDNHFTYSQRDVVLTNCKILRQRVLNQILFECTSLMPR